MNKDLIPYVLNVLKTVLLLTEVYSPVEREFNTLLFRGMIRVVNQQKQITDPVRIGRKEIRFLIGTFFVRMVVLGIDGNLHVFIGENLFDEDVTKYHYAISRVDEDPASLYFYNVREKLCQILQHPTNH